MSKLTALLSKKYLCTTGSKGPAYRCADCIWHGNQNSIACLFTRKVDIHHIQPLKELANTL